MNSTALLLACLAAFGSGNAADAMPAAKLPGIPHADDLLTQVRVVCNKHGRCYRTRQDRAVYSYPSYHIYRRYYHVYASYSCDPRPDYDRWDYYSGYYWGAQLELSLERAWLGLTERLESLARYAHQRLDAAELRMKCQSFRRDFFICRRFYHLDRIAAAETLMTSDNPVGRADAEDWTRAAANPNVQICVPKVS